MADETTKDEEKKFAAFGLTAPGATTPSSILTGEAQLLSSDVGQPVGGFEFDDSQSTTAPTGGDKFAAFGLSPLGSVQSASSFTISPVGGFDAINMTEEEKDRAALDWLSTLRNGEGQNMFVKADILTHVQSLEMAPEVAYVLRNDSLIDRSLAETWPYVMDAILNGTKPGSEDLAYPGLAGNTSMFEREDGYSPILTGPVIDRFWAENGEKLRPGEKEFLTILFSSIPSAQSIYNANAENINLHPVEGNIFQRYWARVQTNWSILGNAPELYVASKGDPRDNVIAQATEYLANRELGGYDFDYTGESPSERQDFYMWLLNTANVEADKIDRMAAGGFDELMARTVALPVTEVKGQAKKPLLSLMTDSPDEYLWREPLTMFQSIAVSMGLDPSMDYTWDGFTGLGDAATEFGLDPITWAGGIGAGLRNVSRIPRLTSRLGAVKELSHLRGGSRLGFAAFDRGIIPRVFWAFGSKTIDDFVATPQAYKQWRWIANTPDAMRISTRYPALKNAPTQLLDDLADAASPDAVMEIWKRTMQGTSAASIPRPRVTTAALEKFKAATSRYRNATDDALDNGTANIRGMDEVMDGVKGVYEPVAEIDPNVRRIADEGIEPTRVVDDFVQGGQALPPVHQTDEAARDNIITAARIVLQHNNGGRSLGSAVLKNGEEISIVAADVLDGGVIYAAKNAAGEIVGAVQRNTSNTSRTGSSLFQGTAEASARQGVMSALYDAAEGAGDDLLKHAGQGISVSGDAAAFAASRAARKIAEAEAATPLLRTSTWTGGGGSRAVISNLGRGDLRTVKLTNPKVLDDLIAWLVQDSNRVKGAVETATALTEGKTLDELGDVGIAAVREYLQAAGKDGMQQGDLLLLGKNVDDAVRRGTDTAEVLKPSAVAAEAAVDYVRSQTELAKVRNVNADGFVLIDIPRAYVSTRLQMQAAKLGRHMGTGKYVTGMRRAGFQIAHGLPEKISLTQGNRGAHALRNWLKAMGSGDEFATKWGTKFLEGTATTRKGIVEDAFRTMGRERGIVPLQYDMVDLVTKQGQVTYSIGRSGADIGLTAQGSVLPMTITHLTNDIAMPAAKGVIKMLRRYERAGSKTSATMRRGSRFAFARGRRAAIVKRLKARTAAKGYNIKHISDDDWLSVGYADVLTQITGRSRPDALGAVNRAAWLATMPYRALHSVFTIGQLAFRPAAWSGRVLIEENIRGDLMGLPSLWSNPSEFVANIMNARAIFKMSDDIAGQARVIDAHVASKLFPSGSPNWGRIEKDIPNIDELLDLNGVLRTQTRRVQAVIAHEMGRSLIGGEAVTNARIGSRFNPFRRAYLRERRIGRAHRTLDDTGLLRSFRWQTDGLDIANRTFYQNFVSEAMSGITDMSWRPGQMSPDMLNAYGTGYARTMFQMFNDDALVRKFGLRRTIARSEGTDIAGDAAELIVMPAWQRIRPLVSRKMVEDGKYVSEMEEAQWYLTHVVDEIADTLLDDLSHGSLDDKARIARGFRDGTPVDVDMGDGVAHSLLMTSDNYQGFVDSVTDLTHSADSLGKALPVRVTAEIDPRFGQRRSEAGFFRRSTDWVMQKAGEGVSQTLHRRPAYLALHKRYYDFAVAAGASPDTARVLADEKAAATVNYIFFNNKDIPQFLHDMNKVIPFFSAMWEVGQTWMYKIPAHEGWPIGAAHLLRKVDRTIDGLHNIGLLETDTDTGQMYLRLEPEGSGLTGALGSAVRAPAYLAEHMVGIGRMLIEPFDMDGVMVEPYKPADLGAWTKDGFKFAIGNPLDPSSNGILAVNQLSVGPSPSIAYPLGQVVNAMYAADTQVVSTKGKTLGDIGEEIDIAELLYVNQDAIKALNSPEAYARAMGRDGDPGSLKLPDSIELPRTSFWETIIEASVFPFGKLDTPGRVITSVIPAALQHAFRGVFTAFGQEDSEIVSFMFGNMSRYQMAGEVLRQQQYLEAREGIGTRIGEKTVELLEMSKEREVELYTGSDGVYQIADPDNPYSGEMQVLIDDINRLSSEWIARSHSNAAGSMFFRTIAGSLLPATPQLYDKETEQASAYWNQREIAEAARIRGDGVDVEALFQSMPGRTGEDLSQALAVTQAFYNDPSGSEAKIWVRQNSPELEPYLVGRSYWGEMGLPPESLQFDAWTDAVAEGKMVPFDSEVYFSKRMRATIAVSRDLAIVQEYGNDPNSAVQQILMDQARYDEVTEPFDMEYEAQEFLDVHMFDGRYAAWRAEQDKDSMSDLSLLKARVQSNQDSIEAVADMLQYFDLTPEEERRFTGLLRGNHGAIKDDLDELIDRNSDGDTPWLNPLELTMVKYWEEIAAPYYDARTAAFEEYITPAKTSMERSVGFERLRLVENEHYNTTHYVEGHGGEQVEVPNNLVRTWNRIPQAERQERILALMDKKPEWLNQFSLDVLVDSSPQLAQVLPTTPELMAIYDRSSMDIIRMQEDHRANPDIITESELERRVADRRERRDNELRARGRYAEIEYRDEWVPAQKLAFAGMLPESLMPILPQLNSIMATLKMQEKSPTTNMGEQYFLKFRTMLETMFFPAYPQAEIDFAELGKTMFNEPLYSAIHARLWQGDRFGKLE